MKRVAKLVIPPRDGKNARAVQCCYLGEGRENTGKGVSSLSQSSSPKAVEEVNPKECIFSRKATLISDVKTMQIHYLRIVLPISLRTSKPLIGNQPARMRVRQK